ncbi:MULTISPECIES: hypothetical protein [Chelativorans]|jgi:hypothetical protein|uniref:hypothetical protein n=1 Tax=Chelativorans TaxID=449972 RepID=UPI001409EA4F|nr:MULTISPECIES: hypothetical protein [Chelativorans]
MSSERIKELRREARSLNAKAKKAAMDAGGWCAVDDDAMADFQRYCQIQIEIAALKKGGGK